MNIDDDAISIRRILVALDASMQSQAALDAAAELASRWHAELRGLFVEDVNLIKMADLPFAREIYSHSATVEAFDVRSLERALKVRAEQARQVLVRAAERAKVPSSFRVVRGEVTTELLAAASEADLLILGKHSRPFARVGRLGSSALASATRARRALFVQPGAESMNRVLAVYDGSPVAKDALTLGVSLADALNASLVVLIPAKAYETAQALKNRAVELVGAVQARTRFRSLPRLNAMSLVRAAQSEDGAVLILSRESLNSEEGIAELIRDIESPVLLV